MSLDGPITVVIGASRGIGAALVKELKAKGHHVVATMRKPTPVEGVQVIPLDITSDESVSAAGKEIKQADTLIINAAVGEDEKLLGISSETLTKCLDANVVGPHRIVKAFLPALRARKTRKIVIISSMSGSKAVQIDSNYAFAGPYAVSKDAVNMIAIQLHNELHKSEGFISVPLKVMWPTSSSTWNRFFPSSSEPLKKEIATTAGCGERTRTPKVYLFVVLVGMSKLAGGRNMVDPSPEDAKARAEKVARAKAQLKKHQKKKAGGAKAGNAASPSPSASTISPGSAPTIAESSNSGDGGAEMTDAGAKKREEEEIALRDTSSLFPADDAGQDADSDRAFFSSPPMSALASSQGFEGQHQNRFEGKPDAESLGVEIARAEQLEIDSLRKELADKQAAISVLVSEKSELSARADELEGRLEEREAAAKEGMDETERLRKELEAMKIEKGEAEGRLAEEKKTGEEQRDKVKTLERELDVSRRQATELRSTITSKDQTIADLEERASSTEEVDGLRKSLAGAEDRVSGLEAELSRRAQTLSDLKEERDKLEREAKAAKTEGDEWQQKLRAANAELDGAREELATTRGNLDELTGKHKTVSSEHETVKASLAAAQTEIEEHKSTIATHADSLRAARDDASAAHKRADAASKKVDGLLVDNERLIKSLDEVKERVGQLTAEKAELGDRIEGLERRIRETDKASQADKERVEGLERRLREADKASQADKERVAQLEEGLENKQGELGGQIAELERKLEAVRGSLAERDSEVDKLSTDLTRRQESLDATSANLAEAKTQAERSREQIDKVEASLSKTQAELDAAKGEVGVLTRSVEELKEEHRQETGRLQAELDEARAAARAADGELKAMAEAKEKEKKEKEKEKANGAVAEGGDMVARDVFDSMMQQHELDLSTARSQVRSLEAKVFAAEDTSHGLRRQLGDLTRQLEELKKSKATVSPSPSLVGGDSLFVPASAPMPLASSSRSHRRSATAMNLPTLSESLESTPSPSFLRSPAPGLTPTRARGIRTQSPSELNLPPETRHRRRESLGMLKARIEDEQGFGGFPGSPSPLSGSGAQTPSTGVTPQTTASGKPFSPNVEVTEDGYVGAKPLPVLSSGTDVLATTTKRQGLHPDALLYCSCCQGDLFVI